MPSMCVGGCGVVVVVVVVGGGGGCYVQVTHVVFLRRAVSIAGILSQLGIVGLQP